MIGRDAIWDLQQVLEVESKCRPLWMLEQNHSSTEEYYIICKVALVNTELFQRDQTLSHGKANSLVFETISLDLDSVHFLNIE